jgi:hypothetical protein
MVFETEKKYVVIVSGCTWRHDPVHTADTLRGVRRIVEAYGDTADTAAVYTRAGRLISRYRRDGNGYGNRWFVTREQGE